MCSGNSINNITVKLFPFSGINFLALNQKCLIFLLKPDSQKNSSDQEKGCRCWWRALMCPAWVWNFSHLLPLTQGGGVVQERERETSEFHAYQCLKFLAMQKCHADNVFVELLSPNPWLSLLLSVTWGCLFNTSWQLHKIFPHFTKFLAVRFYSEQK